MLFTIDTVTGNSIGEDKTLGQALSARFASEQAKELFADHKAVDSARGFLIKELPAED